MEVGQAVLALDLVDPELDLAEGRILLVVEVTDGDFDDTTLERVVRVFWADVRRGCERVYGATY